MSKDLNETKSNELAVQIINSDYNINVANPSNYPFYYRDPYDRYLHHYMSTYNSTITNCHSFYEINNGYTNEYLCDGSYSNYPLQTFETNPIYHFEDILPEQENLSNVQTSELCDYRNQLLGNSATTQNPSREIESENADLKNFYNFVFPEFYPPTYWYNYNENQCVFDETGSNLSEPDLGVMNCNLSTICENVPYNHESEMMQNYQWFEMTSPYIWNYHYNGISEYPLHQQ